MRRAIFPLLVVAAAAALPPLFQTRDPLPGLPSIMLWSWEHADDLRFVDPRVAGVAFLERSVWLSSEGAFSKPRLSQLRYPPDAALMPVVRLEFANRGLPDPDAAAREAALALRIEGLKALQIDFDALESQRDWFAAFLTRLREKMPPGLPLSITSLVSWCREDWVRGLPVDDALPMLFRMGPGVEQPRGPFAAELCRHGSGVALDELPARIEYSRRIFFFQSGRWTKQAYDVALAQARRWR